ncbi:VC2046/SO_2500 family protein [Arsukibacterium sp.]|uniref:VC2046/SO_2500 family protein n=1 Tax=Arsukibacterium sp. TaxID=1977258 RepID=UPI00299D5F25|nr:VC2046/SO_2500 family protein [Arsukibacterium sp.]MDX1676871.1 VC2046/SO_2500 family protein [Arsukibacterium sp.]
MTPIINEWQLDCRLNKALNQSHRADFSLLLAFLSPAIDEMAQFQTPQPEPRTRTSNLYARFSLPEPRGFGWQGQDLAKLSRQNQALHDGGLAQLKLQQYLEPGPMVLTDDNTKLAAEVNQNLDLHSKRRRSGGEGITRDEADPAALYEVLQQLQQAAA